MQIESFYAGMMVGWFTYCAIDRYFERKFRTSYGGYSGKGDGQPHLEPGQDNVDEDITPLVDSFNRKGFKTIASCEGHYCHGEITPAYVAFVADINYAERLNTAITTAKDKGILLLPWNFDASFNNKKELVFRLFVFGDALWVTKALRVKAIYQLFPWKVREKRWTAYKSAFNRDVETLCQAVGQVMEIER